VTSRDNDSSRRGGAPDDKLAFAAGDVVAGRYKIIDVVGVGGSGEVYRAADQALGGTVALKTLKQGFAKHPKLLERFRREVQNARRVTHPNVCRIFDMGIHTSGSHKRFFLTMEPLEGESLAVALAKRDPYAPAEALPILAQIAAGLQAAHDSSVVHRDLKPGNVVLLPPAAGRSAPRAVITDFGLAISEEQISLGLTESSEMIGTPEYMAPEQTDPGSTTPAIDVYALGIIAYELLTKGRPFEAAATPIETLLKRRREKPRPLREAAPGVEPAWDAAIMRCLERDPARRFQRPADFIQALEQPAPAAPPQEGKQGPRQEPRRWFRKPKPR
jgi:serine/threonine protein kinase